MSRRFGGRPSESARDTRFGKRNEPECIANAGPSSSRARSIAAAWVARPGSHGGALKFLYSRCRAVGGTSSIGVARTAASGNPRPLGCRRGNERQSAGPHKRASRHTVGRVESRASSASTAALVSCGPRPRPPVTSRANGVRSVDLVNQRKNTLGLARSKLIWNQSRHRRRVLRKAVGQPADAGEGGVDVEDRGLGTDRRSVTDEGECFGNDGAGIACRAPRASRASRLHRWLRAPRRAWRPAGAKVIKNAKSVTTRSRMPSARPGPRANPREPPRPRENRRDCRTD